MGYNTDFFGQFDLDKPLTLEHAVILLDFNSERHDHLLPNLYTVWCQWIPNEDSTAIVWDGEEKFYEYIAWIEYLIKTYFIPWGYELNGSVEWHGDEYGDIGVIQITKNVVKILHGKIVFVEQEGI